MNIIYVHTHDTGRYIQPYGEAVETPNLMAFANEATLFRNAHCVGPTCSPSRSGLLTGMMPHNNGMLGLAHRGFQLNDFDKHLANYLKKNGYVTALSGIQHLALKSDMIGYDYLIGSEDKTISMNVRDEINAKAACDFIKKQEKPFFLSFGMWNTHRAFPEQSAYNPDYVKVPFPIADTAENREDMARFMASAHYMDKCFGRVYQAIAEAGIKDETVLIFTTDHGIAFPHMKCNLKDTGTGVSLIIDYPENMQKGKVSDALVSHLDIFPTLCELIKIDKPYWLQGVSMAPLFVDVNHVIREELYSEVSYHAAYEPKRSIRTDRYKLIRHYDVHNQVVPSNIDNSPSKTLLIDNGYLNYEIKKEELYDLIIDPVERINLIDHSDYQSVYKELSARLESWQESTSEPLLLGQVKKPDGAAVNRLTCISPEKDDFEEDGIR